MKEAEFYDSIYMKQKYAKLICAIRSQGNGCPFSVSDWKVPQGGFWATGNIRFLDLEAIYINHLYTFIYVYFTIKCFK